MRTWTFLQRFSPHFGEVLQGSGLSFLARIIGVGLAFLLGIMLAQILGAKGFGVYSIAVTCMTLGTIVGRLGVDTAVLRFVASAHSVEDWGQVAAVRRYGLALVLCGSAAVSCAMFVLAPVLATKIFDDPSLTLLLRIIALAIVPTSLLGLNGELLKATRRVGQGTFVQVTMFPLLQLSGVLLLLAIKAEWTPADMAVLHLFAVALTALISFRLWRRNWPGIRSRVHESLLLRKLVSTSIPLFWVALIGATFSLADILMLGIWESSETVGYYAAAARTAGVMTIILAAFNSVTAPKFSELHSRQLMGELSQIARGSSMLMTIMALPLLLLFVFGANLVMRLYGASFVSGSLSLTVLAFGQFVNVACGSVGILLIMTGHERLIRNIMVVAGTINIALNVILIPYFGALGAAIATTASLSAMNMLSVIYVYRKLSINMIALAEPGAMLRFLSIIRDKLTNGGPPPGPAA